MQCQKPPIKCKLLWVAENVSEEENIYSLKILTYHGHNALGTSNLEVFNYFLTNSMD